MWTAVLTVSAFAVAMAHVETMIVVYLRRLYYPDGFRFPLVIIDTPTLLLELEREAATLVMLAAYGLAAGRSRAGKLGNFLIAFGVWDIFYYVWLKVILGWPASLLTWDVLFLIPVPWVGPVLAPVSVAVTMVGMGLILLHLEQRGAVPASGTRVWAAQVVACLVIVASFTLDVLPRLPDRGALLSEWIPTTYRWWMLALGQALAIGTFAAWARRACRVQSPPPAAGEG